MTTNHKELCERLRQASIQCSDCGMYETSSDFDLAVSTIESQAARIAELEKERDAAEKHAAAVSRENFDLEARIAELEKERDALKADAERYVWSISSTDNAESLWSAVMSCGPSARESINIEIAAALQAEKETRS